MRCSGRELALYYFVIVCPLGFFGIKLHYLSKKKKKKTSWRVDIWVRASFKLIVYLDKTCFHPESLSYILGLGLFGVGFDETIKCDAFVCTQKLQCQQ
jgi:hypothetical protein